MAKKKSDETEEVVDTAQDGVEGDSDSAAGAAEAAKPGRGGKAADADAEGGSIVDSVLDTVTSAVEAVAETISEGAAKLAEAVTGTPEKRVGKGKRAEKIGVVASDKMTKTVVVRVDRVIKHPVYRKYVRQRKKFMAHDEFGAKTGDKVRIVETRPLSARKRWRVVEIIQKAEL